MQNISFSNILIIIMAIGIIIEKIFKFKQGQILEKYDKIMLIITSIFLIAVIIILMV